VLDDLSTGREENLEALKASGLLELVVGDVRDESLFTRVLDGCDRVFHLAASVGVGTVTAHPLECLRNNLDGVRALFGAVHAQPHCPQVILFSSSEVYGKTADVPLSERVDFQLGPSDVFRWSYAAAKIAGEYQALCEHEENHVPVVVVRCFNTSGPRQRPTYGMVIPRFFAQALAGDPLTVYGDGRQTRCFTDVQDVVHGVLLLADAPAADGGVFNVGSDQETSVLDLAYRIKSITGSPSEIKHCPYEEVFGGKFEEVRRRVPDLTRLESVTGYRPRTDLDVLLRRVYAASAGAEKSGATPGPLPLRAAASEALP
jgi:UDP-glucose 4-epimerase